MSNENIDVTTETTETTDEQIVVETRVNKKTLQVAAIASLAGAAVATGVALFARSRNDDADEVAEVIYLETEDTPED